MEVYEVFQRRTREDVLTHAGAITAPDLEMAMHLARQTHFRHGEGVECWVVRRADMHQTTADMADHSDRSYRRQDGYVGVGAKHKRVAEAARAAGRAIDAPHPGAARAEH